MGAAGRERAAQDGGEVNHSDGRPPSAVVGTVVTSSNSTIRSFIKATNARIFRRRRWRLRTRPQATAAEATPTSWPNVLGMFRGAISPERYVQFVRGALWSLTVIVITGAAVRLTGSGLGCSAGRPAKRTSSSPRSNTMPHRIGNRLFTRVVTIAVVLAVLGSIRRGPKRRDLIWWSWGLVAGVIAQILLGAVLMLTHLDPRFTMGHFILSMVLLWNAAVLIEKAKTDVATRYRSGWKRRRITTADPQQAAPSSSSARSCSSPA